jgi:glycerol-3-phosphate acyltransferase PlsY
VSQPSLLDWCVVVPAYLIGTFPTALLVGRRTGVDPTRAGSRNPGASNTYRTAGRAAGVLVLLGDLGKGIVATVGGYAIGGRPVAVGCAVAAVLGHVAPVQRRFRGGKGVATAAGGALVLQPVATLVLTALWIAVAVATRRASLASLTIAVGLPIAAAIGGAPAWEIVGLTVISALVIVRHRDNVGRLLRGEERRLGTPSPGW